MLGTLVTWSLPLMNWLTCAPLQDWLLEGCNQFCQPLIQLQDWLLEDEGLAVSLVGFPQLRSS